jgi:UDP-glucose 4-epimerase
MITVALVGASGFVGSQVRAALERRGAQVLRVSAPRLHTSARRPEEVMAEVTRYQGGPEGRVLAGSLDGCDVVVNAAGVAAAAGHGDSLFGANALLPGLLAAVAPRRARFVHVSSAAVQGRIGVLDEAEETHPFSPYSLSKSLGEEAVLAVRSDAVCYRPTSVHGIGRDVTRSLVRVVNSPLASVAGTGDLPSPQVRVENVGDAVAMLATTEETPPRIVLHPSEGLTTGDVVRLLGGREPIRVPRWLARAAVDLAFIVGRLVPASAGVARRLEMLWFGQGQAESWLSERWKPVKGTDSWKELA